MRHFSGNFWWTTAAYYRTLPDEIAVDDYLGSRDHHESVARRAWVRALQHMLTFLRCSSDAALNVRNPLARKGLAQRTCTRLSDTMRTIVAKPARRPGGR